MRQSAEQLRAINEIVSTLSGVVTELRVRFYEGSAARGADSTTSMASHYHQKPIGSDWN